MKMRFMLAQTALLSVLAGCGAGPGSTQWPQDGEQVTVEGEVIAVDREPWMVDGDGTVLVDSPGHGRVTVLVPARINLCQARGMDVATAVEPGDRIRVTGDVLGRARLSACRSAEHVVERMGP